MRLALYFAPEMNDPLSKSAVAWLGRDAYAARSVAQPKTALDPLDLKQWTADPRRYGFHATLKAPFTLAAGDSVESLTKALDEFAGHASAIAIGKLKPARLGSFFALVQAEESDALNQLADNVVTEFDRFRAPLTENERARRRPEQLTPSEIQNLDRWGYPHVFEEFRFHMSLTGKVPDDRAEAVRAAIDRVFAPVLDRQVLVDGLTLFLEPEPGRPFTVRSRHPFRRLS